MSLAPVAKRLSELLNKEVVFAKDDTVVGENAKAAVAAMKDGDVVLLENTRRCLQLQPKSENRLGQYPLHRSCCAHILGWRIAPGR